jgi:putative oxidoreductase
VSLGRTALRVTVGSLMMGHGLQKLTGAFDGPGLAGTQKMTESLGLHPAKQQAMAVGLSETLGGGLTALGMLSPLGPSMIIGTMAVAIHKVHAKNGPWVTKGGYEFNATLIAAALALAWDGPGMVSVDGLFRRRRSGALWGILAGALGAGAAAGTLAISERMKPALAEPESPEAVAEEVASDAAESAAAD